MAASDLELWLLRDIRAVGLPEPETEFRFHKTRKWRFDICWVDQMVAVEVEGGVYMRGRHLRPAGFTEDAIKYNAAISMGWKLYRFTGDMIKSGAAIKFLEENIHK